MYSPAHPYRVCPTIGLNREQQETVRAAIRAIRDGGVSHTAFAKHLGCSTTQPKNWFENGTVPSKKYYEKILNYANSLTGQEIQ
jgi:DNA-binding transcriptional regulator YiaG